MEYFKIEKASEKDHLKLTEITFDGKAFWGYSKNQLEKWRDHLTVTEKYISENETYNLVLNEEIIGYYSILKSSENQLKLDNLFIQQKFIGKGYGKILMDDFLKKVKTRNIKSIILEAEPNAENFYKKFVFVTYDHRESSIKGRFLPQMKLIIS